MSTLTSPAVEPQINELQFPVLRTGGRELLDDLAGRWGQLCDRVQAEPFLRPEWILAYIDSFEPQAELMVLAVTAGDALHAILPLTRKRIWFRGIPLVELKATANPHSVSFDILRAEGEAGRFALEMIWRYVRDVTGWHVLHLPQFPERGVCEDLLACAAADGFLTMTDVYADSPFVRLHDQHGNVAVLTETKRHFRHELRRFARLIESQTGEKPVFTRVVEPIPALLSEFYDLEAAGWKGERNTAIKSETPTLRFYDEIAQTTARLGLFSLNTLTLGGRLIAGCFGVDGNGSFHGMKLTHDETLRRCAPGHLLTLALLENCAARGLQEVSLGGKADDYKKHWTSQTHRSMNGFVFNSSVRSQILYLERTRLFPALRKLEMSVRTWCSQVSVSVRQQLGRAARTRTKRKEKPSCK